MVMLGGTKICHQLVGPVTMSLTCRVLGKIAPCCPGLKDQEPSAKSEGPEDSSAPLTLVSCSGKEGHRGITVKLDTQLSDKLGSSFYRPRVPNKSSQLKAAQPGFLFLQGEVICLQDSTLEWDVLEAVDSFKHKLKNFVNVCLHGRECKYNTESIKLDYYYTMVLVIIPGSGPSRIRYLPLYPTDVQALGSTPLCGLLLSKFHTS